MDAMFIITEEIKEKAIEYNTLIERETPANIVKVVHNPNNANSIWVKSGQPYTKSIPISRGIRQGDSHEKSL